MLDEVLLRLVFFALKINNQYAGSKMMMHELGKCIAAA